MLVQGCYTVLWEPMRSQERRQGKDIMIRLYFLHCGMLDLETRVLIPETPRGPRMRIPVPAVLIQVDGQNILVDTGMPDFCVNNPRALAVEDEGDPPEMVPVMDERE